LTTKAVEEKIIGILSAVFLVDALEKIPELAK
jgi:hypothetical protein